MVKTSAGFTLLEAIIAIIIIAIALMGLISVFARTMTIESINAEENQAMNAARGKMELISLMGYDSVVETFANASNANFPVAGLTPIEGDKDDLAGRVAISDHPGEKRSYVDVTVMVEWTGSGGPDNMSILKRFIK